MKSFHIEVADSANNYEIQFIGCLKNEGQTRILKQEQGYKSFYKIDSSHLFVRAKIISSRTPENPIENMTNELAWTQPVVFSE